MVSHFFSWQKFPEEMWNHFAAEFRDNGAGNLVLLHTWAVRLIQEEGFFEKIQKLCRENRVSITGAHAPFGPDWDLTAVNEDFLLKHEKLPGLLKKLGVKSCTYHIGLFSGTQEESRAHALATLKRLVSCGEKNDVVIAIENAEHPGGACDELLYYRSQIDSPYLGFCYDSGHANVNGGAIAVLEKMLADIVVCHIHDNPGKGDWHMVPGTGSVPWEQVTVMLKKAPRLMEIENESNVLCSKYSYREVCRWFDRFDAEIFKNRQILTNENIRCN